MLKDVLLNLVLSRSSISSSLHAAMYIAASPLTFVRARFRIRRGEGASLSEVISRPSRSSDRIWGTFSRLSI